jgi:hypothetical protein
MSTPKRFHRPAPHKAPDPVLSAAAPPTPNPPFRGDPVSEANKEGGHPAHGGPRTPEGRAVSARNATTHGLFARDVVLPHLGEDPDGYKKVLDTLTEQFDPRTLMERQYLELWAEASWKLRRLSRWEAQLWEQDGLDEDARLGKLERVMRLQNTLRRQLDKAVRMLSRDVPEVQTHYARRAVLASRSVTETDCREDPALAYDVECDVQSEILSAPGLPPTDRARLDASPAPHENCQNEPPPNLPLRGDPAQQGREVSVQQGREVHPPAVNTQNCQNEPPNAHHPSVLPFREDPCERSEQGGGFPVPAKRTRRWVPSPQRSEQGGGSSPEAARRVLDLPAGPQAAFRAECRV